MKLRIFLMSFCVMFCSAAASAQSEKSLLLVNGNIYTVNQNNDVVEAIEIIRGKITAVGTTEKLLQSSRAGVQVIDLNGRTVVPGLIDAHGHLLGLGNSLMNLNLVGTESFQQIIDAVATQAESSAPGEWIIGRGWDQNDWPEKDFPLHNNLSKLSSNNPVLLTRVDGHAALANDQAMRLSGIDKNTPDPAGGKIIRDAAGNPTGVFIDSAMGLVSRNVPPQSFDQIKKLIRKALKECAKYGLTSVHDAGISPYLEDIYKEIIDDGVFKLRVYAMLRASSRNVEETLLPRLQQGPLIDYGNGRLTVRSIKAMTDGALGSRGAALFEDYSDEPGNRGLLITEYEPLRDLSIMALQNGFQVCTHSIGDKGNHTALDAYDDALKQVPNKNHRFRIEHAQVVALKDIPRFDKLNIIASMQATHATSDMYWAEDRVGSERIQGAYAWRRFLELGVTIANGSDFPVEHVNPMLGFYASITRQDAASFPEGGWYPGQRMTHEEALRSFTIDAAFAAFEENTKGSIEVGKWGDLVVLSKNIMTIPPKEILDTQVVMTILGGDVIYKH